MSIVKSRRRNGNRDVFAYDPIRRDKQYVGFVGPCTGNGKARVCKCVECKRARKMETEGADKLAESHIPRSLTVSEWRTEWLERMHGPNTSRPSDTTLKHNRERTSALDETFGTRRLSSIAEDEAEDFALEHPGRVKAVKALFADATRRRKIPENPFGNVRAPKGNGREDITPLTEQEIVRLAEIARSTREFGPFGQEFAALITFAAWTGLRPGEIAGLEWPEVDLRERVLHVWWQRRKDGARVQTKTKLNRTVPLCDQAIAALKLIPQRSGPVFRSQSDLELRPSMLSLYWQPVRDTFAAELAPGHWLSRRLRQDPAAKLEAYEIRHHFGSVLGDQGLSARDIAAVMGNSPEVCERVYVHNYESRVQDRVRAALDAAASNVSVARVGSGRGSEAA